MIKICEKCKQSFNDRPIINGIKKNLNKRKLCIVCQPLLIHHKSTDKTKLCIGGCQRILPQTITHFQRKGVYFSSFCNDCNNKYQNNKNIERKLKALEIYGDNKCQICGYHECLASLIFHHLNPKEKENTIRKISLKKLKNEIKKCLLVCGNCHEEIHAGLHPNILIFVYSENNISKGTVKCRIKHKQEYVNYCGGKCIKCGYNTCLRALDFHHRNPNEKEFSIREQRTKNIQEIKLELDKCDLLCRNCHKEIHSN